MPWPEVLTLTRETLNHAMARGLSFSQSGEVGQNSHSGATEATGPTPVCKVMRVLAPGDNGDPQARGPTTITGSERGSDFQAK
ncbi:hypothetical protein FKM82_029881 [Ascaphus truei]